MRKLIFWLHLSAGVIAGAVILIMSATGVLLTYEKQTVAWADRTDAALPPDSEASRRPVDDLIAIARREAAAPVTALTISSVPGAPALVTAGSRTLALNPYTGAVIGDASPRVRAFFRSVTSWHRYLGAADGPLRQSMRIVTGWSNLVFLIVVAGGAYLWLPRRWTWPQLRPVLWFRSGLAGKARDFNWHNAIGIWCCVPLALIIVGALPISFPWANRAVYQAVGDVPPPPPVRGGEAPSRRGNREGAGRAASTADARPVLEPLWQRAELQIDDWRTIGARLGGEGPMAFTIDRGTGGQPQMRGTLTLDRATATVVRWETFESQSTGRQLRTFLRFAHTGEFFGLAGQTIAGLASAGGVVLVWTGISLALRRLGNWRARAQPAAARSARQRTAA